MKKRFNKKLIMSLAALTLLGSCCNYTSYETARMLNKNQVELMPYISQGPIFFISNNHRNMTININSIYGLSLKYGINELLTISGSFERMSFLLNDEMYGMRIKLKKALQLERNAIAISFGYYSTSLFNFSLDGYSNYYINRNIYYCFGPSINGIVLGTHVKTMTAYAAFIIHNNLTFELDKHFYLRPEISCDIFSIFSGAALFNYGVAGGFTF